MTEKQVFSLFLLAARRCVPRPANGCKSASVGRPDSAANEVSQAPDYSPAAASKGPETRPASAAEVSASRPAGRSCVSMWLVFLSKPGSRQVTYDQFQRACSRTRPLWSRPRYLQPPAREAKRKTRGPPSNHEPNRLCPSRPLSCHTRLSSAGVGENQLPCIMSLRFLLSKNDLSCQLILLQPREKPSL